MFINREREGENYCGIYTLYVEAIAIITKTRPATTTFFDQKKKKRVEKVSTNEKKL